MDKLEFLIEIGRLPRTYRFYWDKGPIRCWINIDNIGHMMDPITAVYHFKTLEYLSIGDAAKAAKALKLDKESAAGLIADIDGHQCEYRIELLDTIAMR